MPNSSEVLNEEISKIIRELNPTTVFDVGVGSGKYGNLIRTICPDCHITGCEIDSSYLDSFRERHVPYYHIFNMSVISVIETMEFDVDLVILGDVLEHLKLSQIFDVLDYFQYRSKYMLCVYPSKLKQGVWQGHINERHLSDVRLKDLVDKYELTYYTKKIDTFFSMNLSLLKGYL